MICTVTMNPALDYTLRLERLVPGEIHRSQSEEFYAGGKGINVSNVLTQMGVPNIALGFVAGFTGDEIQRRARALGITPDFIRLAAGESRINVKLRTQEGETDINAQGSDVDVDSAAVAAFYEKLKTLQKGDFLVLAGSIPESLPKDMYETIMRSLDGKGIQVVVDATGDLLKNTLKWHPFLIKPNKEELGELFGAALGSDGEIFHYAGELQAAGARNILVSKGGEGAVLLCETGERHVAAPIKGEVVSTVGAGDSMVAGFLAGWLEHGDYRKALDWGTAAGAATAFCGQIARGNDIRTLIGCN